MLHDDQRNLIWQIDAACRKCIRAVMHFHAVTGKTPEVWTFLQNCLGEIAVIQWCYVFNNYKDSTHFKQLFDDRVITAIDSEFSVDRIRDRLYAAVGLTVDQYVSFREEMVEFRNKYAAHRDFEKKGVVFPDLDIAMNLCVEMRNILRELVDMAVSTGSGQNSEDLKNILKSYDNKQQLRFFGKEADHLKMTK